MAEREEKVSNYNLKTEHIEQHMNLLAQAHIMWIQWLACSNNNN